MVLVDTSVWIDHLRNGNAKLSNLLDEDLVVCHPWVIGELSLGSLRDRTNFIGLIKNLPSLSVTSPETQFDFIENNKLWGVGIGWVDCQLLSACRHDTAKLFTLDQRLAHIADELGLNYIDRV